MMPTSRNDNAVPVQTLCLYVSHNMMLNSFIDFSEGMTNLILPIFFRALIYYWIIISYYWITMIYYRILITLL